MIRPPTGRLGPITPEERKAIIARARSRANTTRPSTASPPTRCCRSAWRGTAAPGSGAAAAAEYSADRRDRRNDFRDQRAAGKIVDRTAYRAQHHALGHHQGGRRGSGRSRQIRWRCNGQFGRPRPGARHVGRVAAAIAFLAEPALHPKESLTEFSEIRQLSKRQHGAS